MAVLPVLVLLCACARSLGSVASPGAASAFELLILHNNDMHARFEQTSQLSGACTPADRDAGNCYGGFPRVAHVVKEARRAAATGEGPPVLYLNAGDTYTGTVWFTIYKWKIAAEFINALQPDAVSLGNSEFNVNSNELPPFLEELKPTILAANVILNSADAKQKIHKSAIFNFNNVNVGIIGYLTPESKILDSSGNIEYVNEVLAIREEVEKLKTEGVKIIIALGHSESKDLEIAKEVEGLDLVIAGYKNVFFWNGTTADKDSYEAVVVTQDSGRQVPVVQSHAYSKYLGQLSLRFDADGAISSYESGAVLLDETVAQDPEIVQTIEKYRENITSTAEVVVGTTAVVLDGDTCGLEECNFGNLITDAIMYIYAIRFEGDNWTDAPIAVISSGSITGSVAPSDRPASVTRGDLWAVLPAESNVVAVTLTAAALMEMLEHSVADYNPTNPTGQFLQFSGIRVVYDLAQPPGSRVVSIVARCHSCFVPDFYVIDSWRTYTVLMPESLADGAYGYSMFANMPRVNVGDDEATLVAEFIGRRSPVYPEVAQRITLLNVDSIEVEPEPEPEVDPDQEPEPEESMPDSAVALQTSFVLFLGILINYNMM